MATGLQPAGPLSNVKNRHVQEDPAAFPYHEPSPAHLERLPLVFDLRAPLPDRALKRAADVAASLFVLFLGSPLLAVVPLAIWIEGRLCPAHAGPVFDPYISASAGRKFLKLKFRTLRLEGPSRRRLDFRGRLSEHEASNLTHCGRALKSCYLDELPQLLNVLRGEITLTGPRPLAWHHYLRLVRLGHPLGKQMKAGLFGPAHVRKGAPGYPDLTYEYEYVDKCIRLGRNTTPVGGRKAHRPRPYRGSAGPRLVNPLAQIADVMTGPTRRTVDVSVVVPVRDRWDALADCLLSLAGQEPTPSEVIVVDDGGAQPMPEFLREWKPPFALRLERQSPMGIAAARNTGLRLARGGLILMTDSDCVFRPGCLRELCHAAALHPENHAFQLAFVPAGRCLARRCDGIALATRQRHLLADDGCIHYLDTAGFALRRAYLEGRGPLFDVALVRGSDTGLLVRLRTEGSLPRFVESAQIEHRRESRLVHYLLRRFGIGYHDSPSIERLRASGGRTLKGARRAEALRTAWIASGRGVESLAVFLTLLTSHGLELCGRLACKMVGMRPGRTEILGLPLDCLTTVELQERILRAAEARVAAKVTYLTAWSLVQSQTDRGFLRDLRGFDVCYADGMGVALAALVLNARRVRKVTANDFFPDLCREIARRGLSIALVGGDPEVAGIVRKALGISFPGIRIIHSFSGFLPARELERMERDLARNPPNLLVLAMGQPRQERLASKLADSCPHTVIFCVGGLFDNIAGRNPTPPIVIRRAGFEWLWRLVHSPRKLWRRYILGIPALGGYMVREYCARICSLFPFRH